MIKNADVRRIMLIERVGALDVAIGELFAFVHGMRPLAEAERQTINHHARDLAKVASALLLLSRSDINDAIHAAEAADKTKKLLEAYGGIQDLGAVHPDPDLLKRAWLLTKPKRKRSAKA